MNKYTKGAIFSIQVNGEENFFTVVDGTTIEDANYILAVPVEQDGVEAIPYLEDVLAFRTYEDGTLDVEMDEMVISQIVNQLLPS